MIEKIARGMFDPLSSCVAPLSIPLTPDLQKGWKPTFLFKGSTGAVPFLSCHASVLVPGHSPHPPHTHDEEEIILMIAGEADLTFLDNPSGDGTAERRLLPGQFVYYPSGFPHTLKATGTTPASYLMIKWVGPIGNYGSPLTSLEYDTSTLGSTKKRGEGFETTRLFEGSTAFLRKLETHFSTLQPGAGYRPHTDSHDVVIVILEGAVETLGKTVEPFGVIFYRAGEPHGMFNRGENTARYLVFELHGPGIPVTEKWPIGFIIKVFRKIFPRRVRRYIANLLERAGNRLGRKR